jgi:hypothetical protein
MECWPKKKTRPLKSNDLILVIIFKAKIFQSTYFLQGFLTPFFYSMLHSLTPRFGMSKTYSFQPFIIQCWSLEHWKVFFLLALNFGVWKEKNPFNPPKLDTELWKRKKTSCSSNVWCQTLEHQEPKALSPRKPSKKLWRLKAFGFKCSKVEA